MSFQSVYNWFKNWTTPTWLKTLLQELNDLMVEIALQIGKGYIDYLKSKIIEAASHKDWSNDKKFDYVFTAAKKGFVEFSVTLKDSEINSIMEWLVLQLKNSGVI